MRLSTVFELLLIFLLIAFAAYGRVIDRNETLLHRMTRATNQTNFGISILSLKQATENVNKYCKCNSNICNCCRNFHIPIVRLQGPGCASLQYFREDNLAVQLSFGDNILTSTVINGKKPRAICVPMPGGLSKFCGRIYSIEPEADNYFKACLGLELASTTELEASLRVSCFRFGPDGLQLRPAEPLPVIEAAKPADDDEDDDYDIFGLDDDDIDSDEDSPPRDTQHNPSADRPADDDDDDEDVLGFDALVDILTGDDDSEKKKTTTVQPNLLFTIPLINKPIPIPTISPAAQSSSPVKKRPVTGTKKPVKKPETATAILVPEINDLQTEASATDHKENDQTTASSEIVSAQLLNMDHLNEEAIDDSTVTDSVEENIIDEKMSQPIQIKVTETSTIPSEATTTDPKSVIKTSTIKKIVGIRTVKKPSLTSTSINAVTADSKKPLKKPTNPDPITNMNDSNDDDDEDDYALTSEEDGGSELEAASVDTGAGDEYDDDDDDDESEEEEDAVLTALISDDDKENTKDVKFQDNEASKPEDDNADYGMGLVELLARKRKMRNGRQSKVMRL